MNTPHPSRVTVSGPHHVTGVAPAVGLSHRVTIQTHCLGPTNYRPARIVAHVHGGLTGSGKPARIERSRDTDLDVPEDHARVAGELLDLMTGWPPTELLGGSVGPDGYAFVLLPPGGLAALRGLDR